jgi:transcriptional regulator with XRE-family HTH domain
MRLRAGKVSIELQLRVAFHHATRLHISDIERGKREVGIITLQVIARGLSTTMARLLWG